MNSSWANFKAKFLSTKAPSSPHRVNCKVRTTNPFKGNQHRNKMKQWSSINPEKCFRGFNRIPTHGLCVSAAVLHQLSNEDPYVGSRPICWIHRTRERNETYEYYVNCRHKWNEGMIIAVVTQIVTNKCKLQLNSQIWIVRLQFGQSVLSVKQSYLRMIRKAEWFGGA